MKVNIFLRIVNGRGTIRSMKRVISATSRRKTYVQEVSAIGPKYVMIFDPLSVESDPTANDC